MRQKSNSKGLIICTIISVLAFLIFGFSAWYISDISNQNYQGNVKVEGVVGGAAKISIKDEQKDQSVVYGAPAVTDELNWIYSDGAMQENLKLVYDFTFTDVKSSFFLSMDLSVTDTNEGGVAYISQFGESYNSTASYAKAVELGYIADISKADIKVEIPTGTKGVSYQTDQKLFSLSPDGNNTTVKVTITFAWGEAFGNANPYEKYKDLQDDAARTEAANALAHLAACLEGVTFTLSFSSMAVVD